jgi:hypothetical protein
MGRTEFLKRAGCVLAMLLGWAACNAVVWNDNLWR